MYLNKMLPAIAVGFLVSYSSLASAGCGPEFNARYQEPLRLADSLRAEKPGQVRVFAYDGSEFTAGQVQWMHGQTRLIDKACAQGDEATASRVLADVQELLKAHQRRS
jgi:hypothetical protein